MTFNINGSQQIFLVNNTGDTNDSAVSSFPTRSMLAIALCSVTVGLICLVTLLGNMAVVYIIVNSNEMRNKVSSIFLLNLAITDLSSALFIMLSAFLCIAMDIRHVNYVWCNFVCVLRYCLIIVSMITLASIAIERLLSVLYPLRYHSVVTKGRVLIVVAFAWIQGFVFGVVPACRGWIHYDYWEGMCAIRWHQDPRQGRTNYVIAAFSLCFVLPAISILICYVVTVRYTINTKAIPHFSQTYAERRIITSLVVLVALFFVCHSPFSVTKLLMVLSNKQLDMAPYVNLWAAFFSYLSSMVNPFIYGIFRADFQQAARLVIRKWKARSNSHAFPLPAGKKVCPLDTNNLGRKKQESSRDADTKLDNIAGHVW